MAEKGTYPPSGATAPAPGNFPEAPPSYEASMASGPSGANAGMKILTFRHCFSFFNVLLVSGGFVDPNKGQFQGAPPSQGQAPGPAQGQQPTVIVQYMNPPNFGHNPVSDDFSYDLLLGIEFFL